MPNIERHLGATIPFQQYDVTGFAKGYTSIQIDANQPVGLQIEKFLKTINIIDDVLVAVTDAQIRRIQKEYTEEGVKDGGATTVDVAEVMKQVNKQLKANGLE